MGIRRSAVKPTLRLLNAEMRAYHELCAMVDSPRSLAAWLLLTAGEYEQFLSLECDPNHYLTAKVFSEDYLCTEVMKKNPRLDTGINTATVALTKWLADECYCAATTERIDKLFDEPQSCDPWILLTVHKVQRIIQRIIGPCPTDADLRICEMGMRFGPGSTTSTKGVVTYGRKYNNFALDATPDVVSYRAFCFPKAWRSTVTDINIVRGSQLTTVPKNGKTDRCICIEPDLNIFIQLGVGHLLRSKLRRYGLDLNSQEPNQTLASYGVALDLATVDLSSASDTISESVVRLLLPPSWVELLEFSRSPETQLPDGSWHRLQKWSSMGNGYTFELESLIFWACALAVTPESDWDVVSTYGDDIILPISSFEQLTSILTYLGFRINHRKTFGKGLFRESCGTDWFDGVNVRPFYFNSKGEHNDVETVCYTYANKIRRYSSHNGYYGFCDDRYFRTWNVFYQDVPPEFRYHIPDGYGDVGFVCNFEESESNRRRPRDGWAGWHFSYRAVRSERRRLSDLGVLLASLNHQGSEWSLGRETLRGRYLRAARKVGYVLHWPTIGAWA